MNTERALIETTRVDLLAGPEPETWEVVITAFLDSQRSPTTRDTYGHTLRTLPDELGGLGPAEVSAADLTSWAARIRDQVDRGKCAPNTGKRRIMAVKSFFRFCHQVGQSRLGKDLRAFALVAPRDQVRKPMQVLSKREQTALLTAAVGQDRRILAGLLYAGLRVSELCTLRERDYYADDAGRAWLNVSGKGGKSRQVPVGKSLRAELGEPDGAGDAPLFEGRQGAYTRQRVFQIAQAARQVAGIKRRVSPHTLRHSAAMGWLRAKVPLSVIQKWLGHSSLSTTQRYLDHLDAAESHRLMP